MCVPPTVHGRTQTWREAMTWSQGNRLQRRFSGKHDSQTRSVLWRKVPCWTWQSLGRPGPGRASPLLTLNTGLHTAPAGFTVAFLIGFALGMFHLKEEWVLLELWASKAGSLWRFKALCIYFSCVWENVGDRKETRTGHNPQHVTLDFSMFLSCGHESLKSFCP